LRDPASTVHLGGGDTIGYDETVETLSGMGFTYTIFNMPNVYEITPLETFGAIIPVATRM
jgi:hypothetical protein